MEDSMILPMLFGQQAFADVGPFESAQLMDTAHAPRQGDIFLTVGCVILWFDRPTSSFNQCSRLGDWSAQRFF